MTSHIGAPAQPKQPSRKGKKAWRKNVDITEVQSGLESLREEIISGGPLSEKPSEELFALDTTGSTQIKTKYNLSRPLKVDEILAKRSAVPAIDSRKRGRTTDGVTEQPNKKARDSWVSKKDVARLRSVADRTSHLELSHEEDVKSGFDLWAAQPTEITIENDSEYIPKRRAKVAPATIKRTPQAMTANGKPVKAVKRPEGGTSYNPVFEEWDNLLNRAGAEEVAAEEARVLQANADAEKQARIAAIEDNDAGNRTDNESEWEGFETEADESEMLRQKRPKRKTPAERNKINRRKVAERIAKHEKRQDEKQELVEQMLRALITKTETSLDTKLASQDEIEDDGGDDNKLRRRKLGSQLIPEKTLELVLPDELQESLRQLKPEGNLLQDRFRNLLVNGKIESRKPVLQPKKRKVKVTEKWSYKDFSVAV